MMDKTQVSTLINWYIGDYKDFEELTIIREEDRKVIFSGTLSNFLNPVPLMRYESERLMKHFCQHTTMFNGTHAFIYVSDYKPTYENN